MEIKYPKNTSLKLLEAEVNEMCAEGWEPFLPLIAFGESLIQPMRRGETFLGVQNLQATVAFDLANLLEDEQASEALVDSESRSA